MRDRLLSFGLIAAVALGVTFAYGAPKGVITNSVELCDPNAPTNCAAPDASGNLPVTGTFSPTGTAANNADGVAAVATGLQKGVSYPFLFNGTTFDRWYGDLTNGAFVNVKVLPSITGTVTANAGTNLNTSALALDATLATTNTDLGAPGSTACATDTGSCNHNALLQRIAQRLTSLLAGTAVTLPTTPTIAAGNGAVLAPSTEALAAVAPSTAVASAESCRVLKGSAGNLYRVTVAIAATTGYVMIFNATSAPADGAVSPAWPAIRVISDGTSGWYDQGFDPPLRLGTGATVCFSTTGPFSKTASATAAIGGQVQ